MALTGWYETEALLRGGDGDLARAEVARLGAIVGNNRRYRLILLRSQAVVAEWDGAIDAGDSPLAGRAHTGAGNRPARGNMADLGASWAD